MASADTPSEDESKFKPIHYYDNYLKYVNIEYRRLEGLVQNEIKPVTSDIIRKKILETALIYESKSKIMKFKQNVNKTLKKLSGQKTEDELIIKQVTDTDTFNKLTENIRANLPTIQGENWFNCKGDCYKLYNRLMNHELKSTAYMLRTLHKSIISTENKQLLFIFHILDINSLTGIWENDKQYITLSMIDKPISEEEKKDESTEQLFLKELAEQQEDDASDEDDKKNGGKMKSLLRESVHDPLSKIEPDIQNNITPRLIMGFGPSASGKTYLTNQVIELMKTIEPTFPKTFLTIDGGKYRETSAIYKLIVITLLQKHMQLNNMVLAGMTTLRTKIPFEYLGKINDIFKSGNIKKNILNFLTQQIIYGFIISLYVPETLSGCNIANGGYPSCKGVYKKYIEYTGDNNWVGLLIYQHATKETCDEKDDENKCIGCHESGTSRETIEGKRYSGTAWYSSYNNGKLAMNQAPKYRFKIHNTGKWDDGKQHIPTFYDYSKYNKEENIELQQNVEKFVNTKNWKYVFESKQAEVFSSKEEIEKNIKNAKELIAIVDKIRGKNLTISSDEVGMVSLKGGAHEIMRIGDSNMDKVNELIQNKLSSKLNPFYKARWNEFRDQYKTKNPAENPEITTILIDFPKFIKNVYLKFQQTKLDEYQLLTMSMDILAKLAENANKSKAEEDARIKSLLEIALAIAFPEKSLSFDFNMPIILPEPSVRISDLETTTNDIVPQHEYKDKAGKVIFVDKQTRERKDVTKTIYTEENPYTPAYYEHVLQSDGNNEGLEQELNVLEKKIKTSEIKITE